MNKVRDFLRDQVEYKRDGIGTLVGEGVPRVSDPLPQIFGVRSRPTRVTTTP